MTAIGGKQGNIMYEIMGGNMNSRVFYDGGPPAHLEDCEDLESARKFLREWHEADYAAWIVHKDTQEIVS